MALNGNSGFVQKALLDCIVKKLDFEVTSSLVPFGTSLDSCCSEDRPFLGMQELELLPIKAGEWTVPAIRGAMGTKPQYTSIQAMLRFVQCAPISPDGSFLYKEGNEFQESEQKRANRRQEVLFALACCLTSGVVAECGDSQVRLEGVILEPTRPVEVSGGCTIAEYPFYLKGCWNGCEEEG